MRLLVSIAAIVGLLSISALLSACGGGGRTVKVTEQDFAIIPDTASVSHGQIKFEVRNDGPSEHEFVILKTDLAPDQLPTGPEGANEEAEGVQHIAEVEEFESGQTKTLTVTLQPGKYVFICNVGNHYELGMRVGFTVN